MAKDQNFKLRLDAQDRSRLNAVAAHLSAPAATAVRILIKQMYDAINHNNEKGERTWHSEKRSRPRA